MFLQCCYAAHHHSLYGGEHQDRQAGLQVRAARGCHAQHGWLSPLPGIHGRLHSTDAQHSDNAKPSQPNLVRHFLTTFNNIASKQQLRWLQTREPLAYRASIHIKPSVTCPYEILFYSVLKHNITTTRMHTISWQFIPLIQITIIIMAGMAVFFTWLATS